MIAENTFSETMCGSDTGYLPSVFQKRFFAAKIAM